jgi:hypothetical protein
MVVGCTKEQKQTKTNDDQSNTSVSRIAQPQDEIRSDSDSLQSRPVFAKRFINHAIMSGTETPTIYELGDHDYLYGFNQYALRVYRTEAAEENILVFNRHSKSDEEILATIEHDSVYFELSEQSHFLLGLSDHFMFIDFGTAPDPRLLSIYDLRNRKEVHNTPYSSPIELHNSQQLSYFDEVYGVEPNKDNCREIDDWQKGGLGAAIEQEVTFDLNTFQVIQRGEIRCSPRQ